MRVHKLTWRFHPTTPPPPDHHRFELYPAKDSKSQTIAPNLTFTRPRPSQTRCSQTWLSKMRAPNLSPTQTANFSQHGQRKLFVCSVFLPLYPNLAMFRTCVGVGWQIPVYSLSHFLYLSYTRHKFESVPSPDYITKPRHQFKSASSLFWSHKRAKLNCEASARPGHQMESAKPQIPSPTALLQFFRKCAGASSPPNHPKSILPN